MLAQRLRRWPKIKTALFQRVRVFWEDGLKPAGRIYQTRSILCAAACFISQTLNVSTGPALNACGGLDPYYTNHGEYTGKNVFLGEGA